MDLDPDLGLDVDLDLNLSREFTRRTVAIDAAAVVAGLLPTAGAAVHDAPRVAGADGAFGEGTAETATVETDDETERVAPAFRSTDRAIETGLPADGGD